jgi:uracil-DNA glycosylase
MRDYEKFPDSAPGHHGSLFMMVGEAPGRQSLDRARHWTGASGMILRKEIRFLGLDLEDLFYMTNAVKCWPSDRAGKNRSPLASECARCRPFLNREIAAVNPKAIVTVGGRATEAVLGRNVAIREMHGKKTRLNGAPVYPLIHPSNANRLMPWTAYKASVRSLFRRLSLDAGKVGR